MNEQTISSGSSNQTSVAVKKLGLDVHYRQVTIAMQEDGGRIKSAGKMGHQAFANWVEKKCKRQTNPSTER